MPVEAIVVEGKPLAWRDEFALTKELLKREAAGVEVEESTGGEPRSKTAPLSEFLGLPAERQPAWAAADGHVLAVRNEWHEVPQARFDSWSVPMQLAYCARRDEDAAVTTYDPWWAAFYRQRAQRYKEA